MAKKCAACCLCFLLYVAVARIALSTANSRRWAVADVVVGPVAAINHVSYRRGLIEGVVIYTLGRLGALITPAVFPDWLYVALPLLFLALQYLIAPVWATRRIQSTRRERLSKRFWLLGPLLAAICFGI